MRCCFITLGCRVNQYESDAMAELMRNAGYELTDEPKNADVCIVNTCTVTNIADRKSRQMLSRAHRLNEQAKIVVCGCFAQRSAEQARELPGVDAVIGNSDKGKIVEIVNALFEIDRDEEAVLSKPISIVRDVMREHEFEEMSAVREGRTRAYLKIQDGCNMFCAYCAIPFARGAIRSRRLASVRSEAEKLNDGGYAEVVLTGIHLMSYGLDLPEKPNILDALACFDNQNNIRRIRLGSLEPHMMTDEIIYGIAKNPRVCKQFHLSLQSGSTTVLKRMKRGYTAEEYYELCQKLRKAFGDELAITTDIIAGFPGEKRSEHEETLEFIERVGFAKVHVFPYSRRSGTVADRMPNQLSNAEKSSRARELIAKSRICERRFLNRYIGKFMDVLIETNEKDAAFGYTDNYIRVKVPGIQCINTIVNVRIEAVEEALDGELLLVAESKL